MRVKAWNNGTHFSSGAGYGIKLKIEDRDKYLKREWGKVKILFQGSRLIAFVNVDKDSFWEGGCPELVKKEIGIWFLSEGLAPWEKGKPPTLELVPIKEARFELRYSKDER